MITLNTIIREDRVKKNGLAAIEIHVAKPGFIRVRYNIGLNLPPAFFNKAQQKVKPGHANSIKLNARIHELLTELQAYALENPEATPKEIVDAVKSGNKDDFIAYMREQLKSEQGSISWKMMDQYEYCIGHIVKQWGEPYSMTKVTADNIRLLERGLKVEGLGVNTRKHVLKTLRKYTKRAFLRGKIKTYPFDEVKIGNYVDAEREWNTVDEIERLKELLNNMDELPVRLHNTLIHYLHACHCGLRAVDERKFDPEKHVEDGFIKINPSKTAEVKLKRLMIPLNEYAASLHPLIKSHPLKVNHNKIGDDLKEIMELAKIDKHITFHCARHSFAINSLIVGVPIEVVSKWLGHETISTTQIYAKIVESLSTEQMQKWNNYGEQLVLVLKRAESGKYVVSIPEMGLTGQREFENSNEAKLFLVQSLGIK